MLTLERILLLLVASLALSGALPSADAEDAMAIKVKWDDVVATSKSTPTLQVVVNPKLAHGGSLSEPSFAALHQLGADYVRYVPWLPYPKQAVAELDAPANGKTSWDFTYIDPTMDDFMKATEGHSTIINFSTIPSWMYKTSAPVRYPEDPNQVFWNYTQGTEMRDPSMKEAAGYYARLLSWYTKGGFTDELGKRHESGHHYSIPYWEVLNEIDFEHSWRPQDYTRFYDEVVTEMRMVNPQLKFVALALANPSRGAGPEMFEYFLNPAHHKAGVPLDFISYHFYASPTDDQTINDWQYTFFDQAEGFLNTVRYVEQIRKRYSPTTKTDLDELGVILPEDGKENGKAGYVAKDEPAGYWNLAASLYAYLYMETAKIGVDVVGESQLVGYKSQFPSVSMMNYKTGEPNARFWTLKLLKDHFGPGDTLLNTHIEDEAVAAQAFHTKAGKTLLIVNKRLKATSVQLPQDLAGGRVAFVAPSTGDHPPAEESLQGTTLQLQPNEVAVVTHE